MNIFPSFPFYPADWLNDEKVKLMSLAAEGIYIRLLSHQWMEGSIPADRSAIVLLCKNQDTSAIDEALQCFKPCPRKPGRLINRRLSAERAKVEGFYKSKKQAGLRGAEKRWHTHDDAKGLPMAKNSSSSSSSSSSKEEKNTPYTPLSEFLAERVKTNVPFQKIPENFRDAWANVFRLMVEADKIPIDRVREVLDWATTDEFWKVNIRSAGKFREKFGMLEAKSRSINKNDLREAEIQRDRMVGAPPEKTPEEKAKARETDRLVKEYVKQQEAKWDPLIEAAKNQVERDRLRVAANTETEAGVSKIYGFEARS